jgi:PAS domain S-box-containing protein
VKYWDRKPIRRMVASLLPVAALTAGFWLVWRHQPAEIVVSEFGVKCLMLGALSVIPFFGFLLLNCIRQRKIPKEAQKTIDKMDLQYQELQKAKEALSENEELLRKMAENYPNSYVSIIEKDFTIGFTSGLEFKKQNINPEKLVGLTLEEVFPDNADIVRQHYKKTFKGEECSFELSIKNQHQLYRTVPLYSEDHSIPRILVVIENITEQKHAESSIRKSEEHLRSLFRAAPTGIGVVVDRVLKQTNNRLCDITGYSEEEMVGQKSSMLYPSKDDFEYVGREKYEQICDHGTGTVETRWKRKDGHIIDVLLSSTPMDLNDLSKGVTFTALDITETKLLQNQLMQAQKMEAVGTLAGGIAHDFNNILGAILGYAQLAQLKSADNPKIQRYIDQICIASERAKGLVQQILAFSRQSKTEKIPLDIGIIIKEALKLLRASLPSTIEIRQNVKSNLGTIEADQIQIHQIVMNLCTNAFHAMDKKGGQLDVNLTPVKIDTGDSSAYQDIKPGKYLKLIVTDTGHGMNTDTLSRIFEPYFTTKKEGKGTGMGLATVHGIVKNHGGDIKAYSEEGTGTSFQILFPVIESRAEKIIEASDSFPRGTEQILFVDDEKFLADIGKETLESLGYQVEIRTSSYDALEAFRKQPDKYDMVITDITMPKMTGEQLAAEIKKIRPNIPIILCTGFSNRITSEGAIEKGISSILMKPLTIRDLANSVRKIMDKH